MGALDRRNELLLILSARRKDTISNLASELNVCERTILRDISHLSKLSFYLNSYLSNIDFSYSICQSLV